MIFSNAQIYDSIPTLAEAGEEKGLLGYAIAVNLRRLRSEVVEFATRRDELLKQYGTDVGGGRYTFSQADGQRYQQFQEALKPLAEVETDVAVVQVSPEVFYNGGLTSAQMYALSWMVKEE